MYSSSEEPASSRKLSKMSSVQWSVHWCFSLKVFIPSRPWSQHHSLCDSKYKYNHELIQQLNKCDGLPSFSVSCNIEENSRKVSFVVLTGHSYKVCQHMNKSSQRCILLCRSATAREWWVYCKVKWVNAMSAAPSFRNLPPGPYDCPGGIYGHV